MKLLLLILKKRVVVYLHHNYKNVIIYMFLTTFLPFSSSFPSTNTYQILHFLTHYSPTKQPFPTKATLSTKKKTIWSHKLTTIFISFFPLLTITQNQHILPFFHNNSRKHIAKIPIKKFNKHIVKIPL